MATVRIARISAQVNTPSVVRISRIQAISGDAPINAYVRVAGIRAVHVPAGSVYLLVGGTWQPAQVFYRVSGVWV